MFVFEGSFIQLRDVSFKFCSCGYTRIGLDAEVLAKYFQ